MRPIVSQSKNDELSVYLREGLIPYEDDVLQYWRGNKKRFPTLSRMARDYLALQPTSKDTEGLFSKGRRTIPYYRRSQNADTIRNQMLVNSGYNLGLFWGFKAENMLLNIKTAKPHRFSEINWKTAIKLDIENRNRTKTAKIWNSKTAVAVPRLNYS